MCQDKQFMIIFCGPKKFAGIWKHGLLARDYYAREAVGKRWLPIAKKYPDDTQLADYMELIAIDNRDEEWRI